VRDEFLRNVYLKTEEGYRHDNPNEKDSLVSEQYVESIFDYPFRHLVVNS